MQRTTREAALPRRRRLGIWHGTDHQGHGTEIFGTARIHQIWARHGTGRHCQNVSKVWISREKSSWPHLGPSGTNFPWTEKHKKYVMFDYFPWSANQGRPVPCRAQIWWIRAVPNISVPCPDDPCRAKYPRRLRRGNAASLVVR